MVAFCCVLRLFSQTLLFNETFYSREHKGLPKVLHKSTCVHFLKKYWDARVWGKGTVRPCPGETVNCPTPWLEPISQPCRTASHWHTRDSAPLCPDPAQSGQMQRSPSWGRAQRDLGYLKETTSTFLNPVFLLEFLSEHCWNLGAGSYICAFIFNFWLFVFF